MPIVVHPAVQGETERMVRSSFSQEWESVVSALIKLTRQSASSGEFAVDVSPIPSIVGCGKSTFEAGRLGICVLLERRRYGTQSDDLKLWLMGLRSMKLASMIWLLYCCCCCDGEIFSTGVLGSENMSSRA